MHKTVVDPVNYCEEMARTAAIDLPVISEHEWARMSLAALFANYYDSPLLKPFEPRQRRTFVRRWIRRTLDLIKGRGFIGAVLYMADWCGEFFHSFTYVNREITYDFAGFPDDFPIMIESYSKKFTQSGDVAALTDLVGWVNEVGSFLKKLPASRPDLSKAAKPEWVARQRQVKDISAFRENRLRALRYLIRNLTSGIEIDDFEGRHGPGTTAKGDKTIPEKEAAFMHCMQSALITAYHNDSDFTEYPDSPDFARWIDVYKDMGSVRPITAETVNMQFAQQKIKRAMYYYTDEGLCLAGDFIKFSDQTPSRDLAQLGSTAMETDLRPATIDSKSASDFMSADLVSAIFSGDLLHYLMLARTWNVSVNKTDSLYVAVRMYAGMGSATTFPVQSLVFLSIALLALAKSLYERYYVSLDTDEEIAAWFLQLYELGDVDIRRYAKMVRIYGDDVIVPEICTAHLFEILDEVGLVVNVRKSFFGSVVAREACGIYAFAGKDITPVRFRVPFWDQTADYAVVASLVDHANRAFLKGKPTLNRFYIRILQRIKLFVPKREASRQSITIKDRRTVIDKIRVGDAQPFIWEEWRGDNEDYIGVLSIRKIRCESATVRNDSKPTQVAYGPKLKTARDESDDYHLLQNLYNVSFTQEITERTGIYYLSSKQGSHGKIPRGIRLRKRIAQYNGQGWAWVPGQS